MKVLKQLAWRDSHVIAMTNGELPKAQLALAPTVALEHTAYELLASEQIAGCLNRLDLVLLV